MCSTFRENIDEAEEGQDVLQCSSDVLRPREHVAPFIKLNMKKYNLHPRLRSLTVKQVLEAKDPVREHIFVTEANFHKDIRFVIQ